VKKRKHLTGADIKIEVGRIIMEVLKTVVVGKPATAEIRQTTERQAVAAIRREAKRLEIGAVKSKTRFEGTEATPFVNADGVFILEIMTETLWGEEILSAFTLKVMHEEPLRKNVVAVATPASAESSFDSPMPPQMPSLP